MKYNFKKILSALTSAVMISSTVGLAAAANYPAPFVQNGAADVAVVYGASAASTDLAAVTDITNDLQTKLAAQATSSSGETTVSGGDYVKLAKSSDNVNLNDKLSDVFGTSVNDDHLKTLLADGKYLNDENTEYNYEQKVALGTNLQLTYFSDSDYADKDPTVGFRLNSNTHVLQYTLDFTTDAESDVATTDLDDIKTTDLPLLGKVYYVSDADNLTSNNVKLTLLDTANSGVVGEGETVTKVVGSKSYDVKVVFLSTSEVKLSINGEVTNSLSEGQSYKLSDGTYVGIKDISQRDVAGVTGNVEFSLGSGKLEIDGSSNVVELNDDTVEGVTGYIIGGTSAGKQKIDKIILNWTTDDETYLAPGSELVMPGFGALKLSMSQFTMPEQEVVTVDYDGDQSIELSVPIKDGTAKFNILGSNATGYFTQIGGDSSDEILVTNSTAYIAFNQSNDDWFVATYNTTKDAESYLLDATITTSDSYNRTTIRNKVTGQDVCKDKVADDICDIGNVRLTIIEVYKAGNSKWVTLSGGTSVNFNTIFTKDGLGIFLPVVSGSNVSTVWGNINFSGGAAAGNPGLAGHNQNTFDLVMVEEDKDGNKLASGKNFTITLGHDADGDVQVSSVNAGVGATNHKVLGTESDTTARTYTDLATEVKRIVSNDRGKAEVVYNGGESYAEVLLTAAGASVTTGSATLGSVSVKDSEASSVSGKNLIVVGGSCVNSVAAELLGGASAMCGADFTAATGVNAGEFLIETFSRSGGKVATLVAGYNAADTTNAAQALTTQTVDTTVGKKYTGASATSIEAVVSA